MFSSRISGEVCKDGQRKLNKLLTFWYISDASIILMILAFIGIQLQGTLYNYYYTILRNTSHHLVERQYYDIVNCIEIQQYSH